MSINQAGVFFNPPVALNAGEEHNNCRGLSFYRTGVCNALTTPGTGLVVVPTANDHTGLTVQTPSAANIAVVGNYVVLNHMQRSINGMNYNNNFSVLTAATTAKAELNFKAGVGLKLTESGVDYVVVEKQINPANPVYIRFQNPVGVNQGIGYFTDVASADVQLVPKAHWFGVDTYTYENSIEPMTTTQYKNRLRMNGGFGLAPLALRFIPKN